MRNYLTIKHIYPSRSDQPSSLDDRLHLEMRSIEFFYTQKVTLFSTYKYSDNFKKRNNRPFFFRLIALYNTKSLNEEAIHRCTENCSAQVRCENLIRYRAIVTRQPYDEPNISQKIYSKIICARVRFFSKFISIFAN